MTIAFLVFVGGQLTRRLARSERELAGAHRRLTETHTALQDAYGRLARAEAELVETDRMKTLQLLVAGLAHELGNPLTVLAGTVEPLAEAVRAYERALAECARHGGDHAAAAA
jgi:signal transduction histidine kinase